MARRATRNLESKTVRLKLKPRNKGYFTSIERRLALGYVRRPGAEAGRWIAQRETGRTESGAPVRKQRALGLADDYAPADGQTVLNFEQARRKAAGGELSSSAGPLTVGQAIKRYTSGLSERAAADAHSKMNTHVLPKLANVEVSDLTLTQLREWFNGLTKRDPTDTDRERRSKDTANRVLATFKAALNRAFEDEKSGLASDKAWRALKAHKAVGARREDHFTESEVAKLIAKAREQNKHFADLLEAAFYTGARYGELALLDVRHFDPNRSQIAIPGGKTGARITTLTAEGVAFFRGLVDGKKPSTPLLPRSDGERWGKSEQHRPMKTALAAAELPSSASFYTIRHTVISRAIERGMPLTLVAENVGTSVRMIEANYGKFIAATRRELIERTAPSLRVVHDAKRATEAVA